MEVRSANIALTNRAAVAIDNSGSNGKEQQYAMKVSNAVSEENQELDDESVMLSISAAGLKRSLQLEKRTEKEAVEENFTGAVELEDMMKKMEGLSSQVINGHFSISDRLNFNSEIEKLTKESIDVAFLPLDPRQEEQYACGFDYFMRHTQTGCAFPMHLWGKYETCDRLLEDPVSEPYRERVRRITKIHQRFEI